VRAHSWPVPLETAKPMMMLWGEYHLGSVS